MTLSACFVSNPLRKQQFNMLSLFNMCCKMLERSTNYLHHTLTCVCPLESAGRPQRGCDAPQLYEHARSDEPAARALHLHHDLQEQCGHVLAQQAVGAQVQATARRARRLRRLEALAAIMIESDCASALVASVASLPLTLFGPLYMRPFE